MFPCSRNHDILFHLTANVRGLVTRGKLTQDKRDKALSMLKGVLDYSEFRDVDMVIEVGKSWVSLNEILKLFCVSIPLMSEWQDIIYILSTVNSW